MRRLLMTECRVQPGKMQDFLSAVQRWEQDAMSLPSAPEYHAVYLGHGDASTVLVVTQFADSAQAEAFAATGMLESFRTHILACVAGTPSDLSGFDLFYSTGRGGPKVIFGEDA